MKLLRPANGQSGPTTVETPLDSFTMILELYTDAARAKNRLSRRQGRARELE